MNRKIVFFVLIFQAAFAFSQFYNPNIVINSFGYVSFEPFQMVIPDGEGPKFYAGSGVPWGDHSEMELFFTISDPENRFGGEFNLGKEYDEDSLRRFQDSTSVWISPFPWVRLDVGSFSSGTFQGSYGASDFIQYIGPTEEDQYTIFQNFKGKGGTGVLLSITPIENLFFGVLMNPLLGARYDNYKEQPFEAHDIYKNGQYAVAYTIPKIGTARLQYIGGLKRKIYADIDPDPDEEEWDESPIPIPLEAYNIADLGNPLSIQTAFAFTGIENLTIDAGFTYPLPISKDDVTTQRPVKLSAAVVYRDSRWSIGGRIDTSFLGSTRVDQSDINYDIKNGFTLNCNASAGYNFGFATVGGEFAIKYGAPNKGTRRYPVWDEFGDIVEIIDVPESDTHRLVLGAGTWIMKSIGNASIKVGLAVSFPTTNQNEKAYNVSSPKTFDIDHYTKGPWVFTMPIVFGYWL